MSELHFVTGATGFVGGHLVLELLRQTDAQVVCLVRGKRGVTAESRLRSSLAAAAEACHSPELLREIDHRCRAVEGDILQSLAGCGGMPGSVAELWHCAASLRFEEEDEAEIYLHNVRGTYNVLELAEQLRVQRFNYISTAYVAGGRSGHILEELPAADTPTNNFYEQSKIKAELLVAASSHFHTRIMRPSIVIGHSRTLVATGFTGLYGFIGELKRFKRKVARKLGGYLTHRPVRIWADEFAAMNFIPVDAVASNAVRISLSNSTAQIFHLTNECSALLGDSLRALFREMCLREPRFIGSALEFTSIDEAFDSAIRFYRSYLSNSKTFDRTNTDAVAGQMASRYEMAAEDLLRYIRWYLAYLSGIEKSINPDECSVPTPLVTLPDKTIGVLAHG